MSTAKAWPERSVKYLRAMPRAGGLVGVDRENKALRGFVVAQAGVFKDLRGEFDEEGLRGIVQHINASPKGVRSHYQHPSLSDDGLGRWLGRAKNARMDTALSTWGERPVRVAAVRADLHFDASAFKTPSGDLATYVMDVSESDPDAISSSLQIFPEKREKTDARGKALLDEHGEPVPPLWFPRKIYAADIVNVGDAVDGLLSAGIDADSLPDAVQRQGWEMLDRLFGGQAREVIEARCSAFVARYLDSRFGAAPAPEAPRPPAVDEALMRRLRRMGLRVEELGLKARGA